MTEVTIGGEERFELQASNKRSINGMPTFIILRRTNEAGVFIEQRFQGTAVNLKRPEVTGWQ